MPSADAIIFSPAPIAAIAAVCIGFAAFWANPQRWLNRLFFSSSVHVAVWLFAVHFAATTIEGLWWVRMASAIGAFLPIHLWFIQRASISREHVRGGFSRNGLWRTAVAAALAAICFTDFYIPEFASADRHLYGYGYYIYIIGVVGMYVALCRETILQIRAQSGLSRLELQILLLGGSTTALTVILLMALRPLLGHWPSGLQPVLVLVFYSGTIVAMTTSRVFDARQILLVALQKLLLITAATLTAFGLNLIFDLLLPRLFALFTTIGLTLWFASFLNGWLNRILHFYPQAIMARQAAFLAAQRESRLESLEVSFQSVLKGWGQSEHALILSGTKEVLAGQGVELPGSGTVMTALRQLRWATPERLARERPSRERIALREFLTVRGLGVLVLEEGPALTIVIGVGAAVSRRPFTYPQVTQLMELASIMESALERTHFSAKVQHTEQLATVGLLGASLAHEIRNPLVSIKTFVQLLPTHYQDPVFREKFFRLIGAEVGRIDQLTEQLLDLASPRTYSAQIIELHPVLRESLDLMAAKAAHKSVQFLTEFRAIPDRVFTDASAAKQVMINLCFNAIQAVESSAAGERWVRVGTRNTATGIEMIIADSGPGIPPEIQPRLFQPFQTTRSTGVGLGLAICRDILGNLNASISADPPSPGRGATFRVTFPCQPLSS